MRGYNELRIIDKTSTKETPDPIVELNDILKPGKDGKRVRFVLIEGSSGTGKTTLAWQICHKWANEELDSVKKYDLVILVRLKKMRAQMGSELVNLLPKYKKLELDIASSIKEEEGSKVLFVCDSFDALPREQQMSTFYRHLFKGKLLREATVIVTTRPSASASFKAICQQSLDRELEIIGFTDNGINEFASSVFTCPNELDSFWSYIEESYPIYSMMTLPLSAVIVAKVYQDNNIKRGIRHPLPKTMSELFKTFIETSIQSHLENSTEEIPCDFTTSSLLDFSNLPSQVASAFPLIAQIAYDGIRNNKFVFKNLGDQFEDLGLMRKIKRNKYIPNAEDTYVFFHNTLQEYMAAIHIANKLSSQLDSELKHEQNDMILRFLAGMCDCNCEYSLALREWFAQFLGQICSDRSCALQLVHFAHESPSIIELNEQDNDFIVVEPEVGIDWYTMGYCISHFDKMWGLHVTSLRKENIDLLKKGLKSPDHLEKSLKSSPSTCIPTASNTSLKYLHIRKSDVSVSAVIASLGKFCQFQCLELFNVKIDKEDEEALKNLIAVKCCLTSLTYQTDNCNEYTHTSSLIPMLLNDSSLKELVVRTGSVVNLDTELLPDTNTNLEKLTISCELVQPLQALLPKTSLTHLMVDSQVYDIDLPIIKSFIKSHSKLQVLELGKVVHYASSGYASLKSASRNQLHELVEAIISHGQLMLGLHEDDYYYLPDYHNNSRVYRRSD